MRLFRGPGCLQPVDWLPGSGQPGRRGQAVHSGRVPGLRLNCHPSCSIRAMIRRSVAATASVFWVVPILVPTPLAAIGCPGRVTGVAVSPAAGPSAVGAVDLQFYCPPFAPCAGASGVGWHPLQSFNGTLGVPGMKTRGVEIPREFGHSVSLQGYLGANVAARRRCAGYGNR